MIVMTSAVVCGGLVVLFEGSAAFQAIEVRRLPVLFCAFEHRQNRFFGLIPARLVCLGNVRRDPGQYFVHHLIEGVDGVND